MVSTVPLAPTCLTLELARLKTVFQCLQGSSARSQVWNISQLGIQTRTGTARLATSAQAGLTRPLLPLTR